MALFCAAIRRDSVSLLRFPFLRHVHVLSCEISLISHLNVHRFVFFTLFYCYFCSAKPRVVIIVSGGCNQSSSTLFYIVFWSLYRCVNAVFNAGKSASSVFSVKKRVTKGTLLLLLLLLFTSLRAFPTSVSRWLLTGVWVTARLLKSQVLCSVFWIVTSMFDIFFSSFEKFK